ncbi:MAG: hypothetical protein ACO3LE_09665, partial [Bdellovibrionota bacterium]
MLSCFCFVTLILVSAFCFEVRAAEFEYETRERIVDFGIFYPMPQLKAETGISRRQKGTAGFRFHYQFFLNDFLGLSLTPSAWFLPSRIDGAKANLYSLNAEAGVVLRLLSGSYIDPSLYASGGIARMSAGAKFGSVYSYPLTGELGLNLYRDRNRFMDAELAFQVYGGAKYYINVIDAMKPLFYHVGVAFRG